jgi:hypothetical protein
MRILQCIYVLLFEVKLWAYAKKVICLHVFIQGKHIFISAELPSHFGKRLCFLQLLFQIQTLTLSYLYAGSCVSGTYFIIYHATRQYLGAAIGGLFTDRHEGKSIVTVP